MNWLFSRRIDLFVLFAPVWACWLVVFMLPQSIIQTEITIWIWVVFVIGIDVSHVWSTIFRTYLDKEEFNNHRKLLLVAPVLCFVLAYMLASVSLLIFWRCMAYLAVFHFVKQQYGFMRIYKAKGHDFAKKIFNDNWVIYFTMLYPIIFWHLSTDRAFEWFIDRDFVQLTLTEHWFSLFASIGNTIYFLLLTGWLLEELLRKQSLIIGKVLWVLTTAGNWFIGIVYFNSDLVFTITNVVAHGIPYLALIIFYQTKKQAIIYRRTGKFFRIGARIISVVLVLAFFEEYLWDMLVYRDNMHLFSQILKYPDEMLPVFWQKVALAALAVPQITHYLLDGFIWKNNHRNPYLKPVLLK